MLKQSRQDFSKFLMIACATINDFNLSEMNEQLLIPNGNWSSVSSPVYPSSHGPFLYDGYVNTFYHTRDRGIAYQWVSVNLGITVNVCICSLLCLNPQLSKKYFQFRPYTR